MKTPEEMASNWYWANLTEEAPIVMLSNPVKYPPCPRKAFIAGYQAAKDQLADADKVMNSSNNSNGWISVKERLPEDHQYVLGVVFGDIEIGYINRLTTDPNEFSWEAGDNWIDKGHSALTHWMPLPTPPEESKT